MTYWRKIMNIEKALEIVCCKYCANNGLLPEMAPKIVPSLERYLTYLYEMSPLSNDSHLEQFMAQELLDNWPQYVTMGWSHDVHKICNDTPKCDELFEPVMV